MAALGSATATGGLLGGPWGAAVGGLFDVGRGLFNWFGGRGRERERREWESEEREKDREFQREMRRRKEAIYAQYVNRVREGRQAYSGRRLAGMVAAETLNPSIHGSPGFDMSALIEDERNRLHSGPDATPYVLPAAQGVMPPARIDPRMTAIPELG